MVPHSTNFLCGYHKLTIRHGGELVIERDGAAQALHLSDEMRVFFADLGAGGIRASVGADVAAHL